MNDQENTLFSMDSVQTIVVHNIVGNAMEKEFVSHLLLHTFSIQTETNHFMTCLNNRKCTKSESDGYVLMNGVCRECSDHISECLKCSFDGR